jgi:hypothetical protein
MRERLMRIHRRRGLLLARAAAERETLGAALARLETAERWLDRGASWLRGGGWRPVWIAGAAAFLIGLRPRRALKWAASAWSLWRLWRRARRWWHLFSAPGVRQAGHGAN